MTEMSPSNACDGWDNSACEGSSLCPPRCPRFIDKKGLPILIRPLDEHDTARLITMYEDVDEDHRTMGLPPVTSKAIEAWINSLTQEGWNLVALVEDRVVGHIGVAPTTVRDPQFVAFVHQAYQNRGIGTELVKQLIAYAADREYKALTLDVSPDNSQAISIYQNVGFEPEDLDMSPDVDESYIEMRLSFPHPIAEYVQLPPAER